VTLSCDFSLIQRLSHLIGRLLLVFVCCGTTQAQPQENRVALVIGNSAYKQAPLRNPSNDARDMAVKLRSLGFTVIERNNLGIRQIGGTLREFRSKLTPGSVALVYYAGHGLQIKGENYLPAVDAEISGEEDVPNQSLAMRQIMDVLGDAKTRLNLVFLDACRDNPYARSFRSAARGLSKENAPSGTLISFATRPGGVAADGEGRNGLYTEHLLKAMEVQGLPIELALKRVVNAVKGASGGRQEPWMEGSIEGDFYFAPGGSGASTQVAAIVPVPLPQGGGLSLEDLNQHQNTRNKWARWQDAMKADFDRVTALNADPDLQITAWDRFLDGYKDKNPFSNEDDRLRGEARSRKQLAENERQRRLARLSTSPSAQAMPAAPTAPLPAAGVFNSAIEAELRRFGR
jgi:hypothetical protein